MGNIAHRYALQKVYVTWAMKSDVKVGDIVLFYRMGEEGRKGYTSVLTTVAVIDDFVTNFKNKKEFMDYCKNRSVFSKLELNDFWEKHRYSICVIKFIYINILESRLNLKYLWENNIIEYPHGPRPFIKLDNTQYEKIIKDSHTKIYKVGDINE